MSDELLPVPELVDPIDAFAAGQYRIAMIIDGVVHQILVLTAPDAARFLSEPKFVQIPRTLYVAPGDTYDGTTFIPKI